MQSQIVVEDLIQELIREADEIQKYVLSGKADYRQAVNRIDLWQIRAAPVLEMVK